MGAANQGSKFTAHCFKKNGTSTQQMALPHNKYTHKFYQIPTLISTESQKEVAEFYLWCTQ
jgi:hypothetical protein